MFHKITDADIKKIVRETQKEDARCLGLPEMSTKAWDFEKDYIKAVQWARECFDILPKEVTDIVLGWIDAKGEKVLLTHPEVYTAKGFADYVGYSARCKHKIDYAVHA